MKKGLTFWLMIFAFLASSACQPSGRGKTNSEAQQTILQPSPDAPESKAAERYLVVYCSRSGNTAEVAAYLSLQLGGDLLEVKPATPYAENYNDMLTRAQQELKESRQGHYPSIITKVDNLTDYDVILVGYPIWYGSMATPMQTFLHNHADRLAGQRIALFATSGSSAMTNSTKEARALCPKATFLHPTLLLTSSTMRNYRETIQKWLDELSL